MASVSSQPEMSCHAGRVKRKKFSGRPKIGSNDRHTAHGGRRVPKESQGWPFRHHAGARHQGNGDRSAESDEAHDRFNREPYGLPAEENSVTAGQIGQMRALESGKRSVENEKGGCRKEGEDAPLKRQRFGEDAAVTERPEPQQVDEIRERGATAEDDDGDGREEEKEAAAAPRRVLQWPVYRCGHC